MKNNIEQKALRGAGTLGRPGRPRKKRAERKSKAFVVKTTESLHEEFREFAHRERRQFAPAVAYLAEIGLRVVNAQQRPSPEPHRSAAQ